MNGKKVRQIKSLAKGDKKVARKLRKKYHQDLDFKKSLVKNYQPSQARQ